MKLSHITQPPFNTTLMGVIKAAIDHYGLDVSEAAVYGGSGHAFLVNVHEAICPSSPYCWKPGDFFSLVGNLGIEMTDLGFFHAGSPPEERAAVEERIRKHLDGGDPCSVCNTDHQVITGYEDGKFLLARPWPANPDYPPGTLTFRTWDEFGDEVHANFFAYRRVEPADALTVLRGGLAFAAALNREPESFEFERYGIGPRAWDNWAAAAEEHGATHGNWWNATVWGECRARAADYLAEAAGGLEGDAATRATELSAAYTEIAGKLEEMADKELDPAAKADLARDLKAREATAVTKVEELLALLT